jgi:cell fate (sporulation/competence/biofilm development) regulator YmcA (YheA/YmcA/DUF963 family)
VVALEKKFEDLVCTSQRTYSVSTIKRNQLNAFHSENYTKRQAYNNYTVKQDAVFNRLTFITVVESVYSAVRTDSLYKADYV